MAGRMMMTVPVCEDVAMRFGASAGDKDQARPSVYAHKTSVTQGLSTSEEARPFFVHRPLRGPVGGSARQQN